MRRFVFAAGVAAFTISGPAAAQDDTILFTNVNAFDGVTEALIENANVVVTGNQMSDDTTKSKRHLSQTI